MEICIKGDEEFIRAQYTKWVTGFSLTDSEYLVLSACSDYKNVGRVEKACIRESLKITVHNLNNIIFRLKNKGYLKYCKTERAYSTIIDYDNLDNIIIKFKEDSE